MNISYDKFLKYLNDTDFTEFIKKGFEINAPGRSFEHNWHIALLADRLEKVERGEIKRLIINLPPRFCKSTLISVLWPAWLLGKSPNKKIISVSYSQKLSNKLSIDCRNFITSSYYQNLFPNTRLAKDQNEKYKFMTNKRGFRLATSPGGSLTGEGGDIIILDDPHNPKQAMSNSHRIKTIEWFENTLLSRLDDRKNGAIVVVMQRLHTDDLTGHLLKQGGWEQVSLPIIATKDEEFPIGKYNVLWPKGSLLQENRYNLQDVELLKKEMGSQAFSAQYLQQPMQEQGAVIRRSWLARYKNLDLSTMDKIYMSVDCANKTSLHNDYSVCTVWGERKDGFYLLDVIREKLVYSDLRDMLKKQAEKWKPHYIIIEDQASGQILYQELKANSKLPVMAYQPKGDKLTRLYKVINLFETGRVWLPDQASWLTDYELELFNFPHVSHDDQLDSTTQFLDFMAKHTTQKRVLSTL